MLSSFTQPFCLQFLNCFLILFLFHCYFCWGHLLGAMPCSYPQEVQMVLSHNHMLRGVHPSHCSAETISVNSMLALSICFLRCEETSPWWFPPSSQFHNDKRTLNYLVLLTRLFLVHRQWSGQNNNAGWGLPMGGENRKQSQFTYSYTHCHWIQTFLDSK